MPAGTPAADHRSAQQGPERGAPAAPEMRQKLAEQGAEAIGGPPEAFAQAHRRRAREVVARHQAPPTSSSTEMGFLAARDGAHQVSRPRGAAQRARELRAAGKRHHRAGAGRARFQHARPRDRGGAPEPCTPAQTHYTPVDGTPELKAAIVAKFKRENGLECKPGEHLRRRRRQAGPLQRADGDARPRRRSADSGAVLGGVRRHHALCRGHRRCGFRPAGTFKLAPGRPGSRDHAAHQMADAQLAKQPERRGVQRSREYRALAAVLERHRQVWVHRPTTCTSTSCSTAGASRPWRRRRRNSPSAR